MGTMSYEVRFRGQNAYEAEAPVLPHVGQMRAWAPSNRKPFEVDLPTATRRFRELVQDGIRGHAVDGVVPHVVEIRSVVYKRRKTVRVCNTVLAQYAEDNAVQWGEWIRIESAASVHDDADEHEPSGIAVGEGTLN